MFLEAMPEVLTWRAGEDVLGRVHDEWMSLVTRSLIILRSGIRSEASEVAERLDVSLSRASEETFVRVLLAPETSNRLLSPGTRGSIEIADFIDRALVVEEVRVGQRASLDEDSWTALGDALVRRSGEVVAGPTVAGLMPLDMGSPWAARMDLMGVEDDPWATPRPPLAGEDRAIALKRLASVDQGLLVASSVLHRFVTVFTKVLVLQKDSQVGYLSGSNAQYIGRSHIANPHIASVGPEELAEAVVHEAIHALLSVQEWRRPWVLDPSLFESTPRLVSPWTGTPLPVRPFLQACFVWFGLLHFWALALGHGTFAKERVLARMAVAASGFLGQPLERQLDAYRGFIGDDVLSAIAAMQRIVGDSLVTR